ncbi:hypothetical protein MRX96_027921 [Rhipicephalus microplus]
MDEYLSTGSDDSNDFGREEDAELADPANHFAFDPLASPSEESSDSDSATQEGLRIKNGEWVEDSSRSRGLCTFVRKGITSVGKDEILNYKDSAIEANVTEIIIAGKKGRGKNKASTTVYIANVYSNPQHGNQRFKTLLHKIRDAAHGSGAAAVVCGDFNAPHEELGYTRTTVKGKRLLEDAEEASFELLTDPAQPTRIGTSTARDTTPDLSFVHLPRGGTARWKNTGWNLGSDHYIVEVTIPLAHARVVDGTTKRRQLLTDWHKFREADLGEVDDVERWSASLVSAAKDATTEVEILHAAANQLGEAEMHKRLNDKRLLERVGLSSPEEQDHETSPLTESTMRRLVVYPLPKNMGPGESEGRRAARARALLLQHQNDEGAVYVDVAKVKNKDAYVAAAVAATTGKIVTSCSVRTRSASQAEEMAIALAARSPGVRTILSDSKTAIRSFSRGAALGLLLSFDRFAGGIWTPQRTVSSLTALPCAECFSAPIDELGSGAFDGLMDRLDYAPHRRRISHRNAIDIVHL